MKRNFTKILAAFALLVFTMPSLVAWGQTYEEVLTLNCASASAQGTPELYGTNGTTTMTVAGIKAYLKVAAGATNDIVSGDVTKTGDVYWKKGNGGEGWQQTGRRRRSQGKLFRRCRFLAAGFESRKGPAGRV